MLDHAVVAAAVGPVEIDDVAGALTKLDHSQVVIMAAVGIEVFMDQALVIADAAGEAADGVRERRDAMMILNRKFSRGQIASRIARQYPRSDSL